MKRRIMIAIAVVLVAVLSSYAVFAQQQSQTPGQPGGTMRPGMGMGRGRMMMGAGGAHMQGCPMCGPMMGAMMYKTMTPTQDGGVIVAVGNKLLRYDSQLKLIAETQIQIDPNEMFGNMQKMMESCPMYRQMQQSQGQAQTQP